MPVFLPIAGVTTNLLLLLTAGLMIGFFSGLTGVGGGFLLTPLLIMIGVPPTVAAASGSNSIVATSSCAVGAHFRLGNVDIKLGTILLMGSLCGSAVGVEVIKVLTAMGGANLLIRVCYVVMLSTVGAYMFADGFRALRKESAASETPEPGRFQKLAEHLPWQIEFPASGVRHSVILPFLLCSFVGVLTAIMGVGGGFLIVPLMVYMLRVPLRLAVGTSLFQILFTCIGVTYMLSVTNQTVDLELALLLGAGSTFGAQLGVQMNRRLRGDHLKIVLASLALAVAAKMATSLVMTPASLLSHLPGHTP
jgi:uncharacterized membrane protein YfcA